VLEAIVLAAATETASNMGWFLRNQSAARVNPYGLFDEIRIGWRQRTLRSLRASTAVGLNASVSPAFARAGVYAEYAFPGVELFGIYEAGGYFGPLGLHSFPTAGGARYSEDDLAHDPVYPAAMQQLIAGTLVHVEAGPFIFSSNSRFVFQQVAIREGDRVFYDWNWDILFPNKGWIYVNDIDALVQPIRHFRVGVRYDITHAFYSSADAATNDTTQRIGPIASYVFSEHERAAFNAPTIALVVNWWIEHPYRADSALPYLGLAFTFKSNL
jgi:hypothetical protein